MAVSSIHPSTVSTVPTNSEKTIPTPVDKETAGRILDLWFPRRTVFAFQWFNEQKQIGGYAKACTHRAPWLANNCQKREKDTPCSRCEHFTPIPMDEKVIGMHLRGMVTVGSYQLAEDGTSVKWACLDFDDHGDVEEASLRKATLLAQESLQDLHMPTVLEASGGKGWRAHLWAFFLYPLPAIKVRTVLDEALFQAGLHERTYIERFPKQDRALNGYGNLVKIPFGVHRKSGNRSQFLDGNLQPIPSVEEALEMITEIDPLAVDIIIEQRQLKPRQLTGVEPTPVKHFDHPEAAMNGILTRCWYFQEVERRQMTRAVPVHYEDWWNYVLMLCRFGQAGIERIMRLSALDERFDPYYTMNVVNYLRQHGYHAPSCRRLREGPGQIHCPRDPSECGAG